MLFPVKPPPFSVRALIESKIGNDLAQEFARFAFGENFRTLAQSEYVKVWNELHGDKKMLQGDARPIDDIEEMIEIWKKSVTDGMA